MRKGEFTIMANHNISKHEDAGDTNANTNIGGKLAEAIGAFVEKAKGNAGKAALGLSIGVLVVAGAGCAAETPVAAYEDSVESNGGSDAGEGSVGGASEYLPEDVALPDAAEQVPPKSPIWVNPDNEYSTPEELQDELRIMEYLPDGYHFTLLKTDVEYVDPPLYYLTVAREYTYPDGTTEMRNYEYIFPANQDIDSMISAIQTRTDAAENIENIDGRVRFTVRDDLWISYLDDAGMNEYKDELQAKAQYRPALVVVATKG
jgi:hypothetical protein